MSPAAAIEELRSLLIPGRTFVLLGFSGVGKSTLMNVSPVSYQFALRSCCPGILAQKPKLSLRNIPRTSETTHNINVPLFQVDTYGPQLG